RLAAGLAALSGRALAATCYRVVNFLEHESHRGRNGAVESPLGHLLLIERSINEPTQLIVPAIQLDGLKLCPANTASELSRCGLGLVLKVRARMPPPLKDVRLVIAETLEVALVVRQSQPIRDGSRRKHLRPLVFVGAQPVRRFSGPTARCGRPDPRRQGNPAIPAGRRIVGRAKDRVGSPAGPRAATCPVPTEFGAVASLGFALRPGSSYLDPISTRFAADFPPTAQTVGLGVFVARFFLCPKVDAIPTQPLVH